MLNNRTEIIPRIKNKYKSDQEAIGYLFIGIYEKHSDMKNEFIQNMHSMLDEANDLNKISEIFKQLSQDSELYLHNLDKIELLNLLYESFGDYLNIHSNNNNHIQYDINDLEDIGTMSYNDYYSVLSNVIKHKKYGVYDGNEYYKDDMNYRDNIYFYNDNSNPLLDWKKFAKNFNKYCSNRSYKPIGILCQKLIDVKYIIDHREEGFLESHRDKYEEFNDILIELNSYDDPIDKYIRYYEMFDLEFPEEIKMELEMRNKGKQKSVSAPELKSHKGKKPQKKKTTSVALNSKLIALFQEDNDTSYQEIEPPPETEETEINYDELDLSSLDNALKF